MTFKHISDILDDMNSKDLRAVNEINRFTSRHIAKLLSHFDSKNINLTDFEKEAIKAQFRMLQDDIINYVRDVKNDQFNR